MIKSFIELQERLQQSGQKHRIAAVCANDEATRESLRMAEEAGLAEAVYVDDNDPTVAAANAVAMIRRGEADILMKGLIGTDQLLRAILNKETGLLPKGNVMTHMVMAELERYHKLLFMTDVAVIPYPTHEQRMEQVRYAAQICRNMGIEEPRIALLHCAEHGGKQFPFVDGYAEIIQKAEAGGFGPCRVDGPMDLKCACCPEALQAKGMHSSLEGDADVLVLPDLEAGNILYKALTFLVESKTAGILCGTQCPVILPSRGDSAEVKFNSILFALGSL
jgi:phosphate butyryltransferase